MSQSDTATCQNCGWQGPLHRMREIEPDAHQWWAPGDIVPAGVCPTGCGGACFLDQPYRDPWVKTADRLPPDFESVLGRWLSWREHHVCLRADEFAERDDADGRAFRVFRVGDDTGEAVDDPDYWRPLDVPRAEIEPRAERIATEDGRFEQDAEGRWFGTVAYGAGAIEVHAATEAMARRRLRDAIAARIED